MLIRKKILLCVTGSIAAYKAAYITRLLVQAGAEVKVVVSKGALNFITPLTFSTLSKNPVFSDFTEDPDSGKWTNHVELGLWADLMVMAPLSANTLSKMAQGQSDNFLLATYMSVRCPVMVAPAMDHDMYSHPATQENLLKLKSYNHIVLEPASGQLASGLVGKGRMSEPEDIFEAIIAHFHPELPLQGKEVLVTAGPTYERIDPVRFISNFSTGKMGYAIAHALASKGARVHLVSGPTHETLFHPLVKIYNVESAQEMYDSCIALFEAMQISVLCAAVADFRPKKQVTEKIKKKDNSLTIELETTQDIAKELGRRKTSGQYLIGFALETENETEHTQAKLISKNLDMIVLNSLRDSGAGFGSDTNKISVFWPNNKVLHFGLKPKIQVAQDITELIIQMISQ